MRQEKRKDFIRKMGKKSNRLRLKNGGVIQRFADGGVPGVTGPGQGPAVNNAQSTTQGLGGAIGNVLGTNNNFQAAGANIQAGTTADQINQAYIQAQQGLQNQGAITTALTPQIANAVDQQNQLAQQYAQEAQGLGPNVAQTQLAQATGANVANQAALMAGQRGAAGNVGLMARQAAMQGAGIQQQAAGQAATLGAQQQIAAQQNLANLSATQAGQAQGAVTGENQANQAEQNIVQGANTAYNNAGVGMQSNINNTDAQTAAANAASHTGIIGGAIKGVSSLLSLAEGGEVHPYAAGGPVVQINGNPLVGPQAQAPGVQPMSSIGQWVAGQGPGSGPNIETRDVSAKADTTLMDAIPDKKKKKPTADIPIDLEEEPTAYAGDDMSPQNEVMAARGGRIAKGPHSSHVANFLFAGGGKVEALVSPGEVYLSPDKVQRVLAGENPLKIGHKFAGKAKVKDDSLKNDFIPANLDDGGVVIPRHITTHKMGAEKAELFVHRAIAKKRAGR